MSTTDSPSTPASLAERYRVLLEIGHSLTGALRGDDDLYASIYRETARVIEADGFYVSLYNPETDEAVVVFWADRGEGRQSRIVYKGSDSEVIRMGRGAIVQDGLEDQSLLVIGEEGNEVTRSAISAPLRSRGKVLGVISAQSYRPSAYSTSDLELLQGIADLAAVATQNAEYVSELERRRREAEEMEEISQALVSSLETQDVLNRLADATLELLEADGAAVWLLEEGAAVAAATRGSTAPPAGTRLPLEGELVRRLLDDRQPVVVENIPETPLLTPRLRESLRSQHAMIVPLIAEDQLMGALSVGVKQVDRSFSEEEVHLLQRVAGHAAVALHNARLHQQLQAISLTDPLTGLPNRRHLEMHLSREFAAARRGRELSVVLFDLDNFKQYNDSLGHLAGDDALRAIGEVLQGETRAMNLVARYGGDEFLAVLSDTPLEGARLHASRVEEKVARHPGLGPHGITVSCGVASYGENTAGIDDLVREADEDMYRSKAASRRNDS